MSTFPVREIVYRRRTMSVPRSDFLATVGTPSRPIDMCDVISPGLSSLSSSSAQTASCSSDSKSSAWDFEKVERIGTRESPAWKCGWCGRTFKGWNATKVMNHVAKATGKTDIVSCTGSIPKATLSFFQAFRCKKMGMSALKRQHGEAIVDTISENQTSIAVHLQEKRARSSNSASAGNNYVALTSDDGCVEATNATRLTAAIAEFIFCKGLSFSATEGDHFMQILKLARLVPLSYRPPNRNVICNELLDLSYDNRLVRYVAALDVDADIYGLSLFGDGATVHGMPLMNILASGFGEPCAVLSIVDCKFDPFPSRLFYFISVLHSQFIFLLSSCPTTQVRTISSMAKRRMPPM
jgi:hypothetical protein